MKRDGFCIMSLDVGNNFPDALIGSLVVRRGIGMGKILRVKKFPEFLQSSDNFEFIEWSLFVIFRNNVLYDSGKGDMPVLASIDTQGRHGKIMNDWLDVVKFEQTVGEAGNELRGEGDGDIFAVVLILHASGVERIGVCKNDVTLF